MTINALAIVPRAKFAAPRGRLQPEHLPPHILQFIDVCAPRIGLPSSGLVFEIGPRLLLGHFLQRFDPNGLRHNQPKTIVATRQRQNLRLASDGNRSCRFVRCFLTLARTINISGSIAFVPGLSAQAIE